MSHSSLAALRGEPSYLWRAGQARRLAMLAQWLNTAPDARWLVDGCGNGMYAAQIRQRFTSHVEALDIELERVAEAQSATPHALVGAAEALPYPSNHFDSVLSHEVIEHVQDDRRAAQEIMRVLKPGGRVGLFAPNRWYPFETHGHYWRGEYHFGNTPLINYLPDALRNTLAPHVRAYTQRGLLALFAGTPHKLIHASRVYGGYDNLIRRFGALAETVRNRLYQLEGTPLDVWGLSHWIVIEKLA
ncbi:MAG: methyltransferase domain-containing protein [Phototrophicaceae bacterium]